MWDLQRVSAVQCDEECLPKMDFLHERDGPVDGQVIVSNPIRTPKVRILV